MRNWTFDPRGFRADPERADDDGEDTLAEEAPLRRPVIALALLLGAVAATTQAATTGSNEMPSTTTAVHRGTSVTGASAVRVTYTVTGNAVTTVTARLQKVDLLGTTVTAAFGSDPAVTCVAGVITIVDLLLNLGQADYTCTGFFENAERPRALKVTAS